MDTNKNSETPRPRVGFIGLGLMGAGMARNIAKSGFPLTVYNRTQARAETLAAEVGCATAATPREVAAESDIVITMVSDVPDVEHVYLDDDGILETARPGLVCIDMSTVGAACARRVAAALEAAGAAFVDAPVSGGSWGATQGTLSIMAGGTEAAFAAALPVFEAMGKKIVHCGPVGSGQATKLVNQVVAGVNLQAVTEGILLSRLSGLNTEKTIDAVGAGAAASWAWNTLGPKMASGDYAPGFKIAHQIKDLRLALEAADEVGISLPGVRLVLEYLQRVRDAAPENGDLGTQALIEILLPGHDHDGR